MLELTPEELRLVAVELRVRADQLADIGEIKVSDQLYGISYAIWESVTE